MRIPSVYDFGLAVDSDPSLGGTRGSGTEFRQGAFDGQSGASENPFDVTEMMVTLIGQLHTICALPSGLRDEHASVQFRVEVVETLRSDIPAFLSPGIGSLLGFHLGVWGRSFVSVTRERRRGAGYLVPSLPI
ncbi:hypothetical protein ACFL3S_10250 [Gemmatimonadota bacterium]